MELKKVIAVISVATSLGSVALIASAATTGQSDGNRTWTYGKNTSTTAISNLLDNVATHSSDVLNETTGAFSGTVTAAVRTTSYAKVAATSTHTMLYESSVAYWDPVLTTK